MATRLRAMNGAAEKSSSCAGIHLLPCLLWIILHAFVPIVSRLAVVFLESDVVYWQLPGRSSGLDEDTQGAASKGGRRIGKPVKSRRCPRNGGGANSHGRRPLDTASGKAPGRSLADGSRARKPALKQK